MMTNFDTISRPLNDNYGGSNKLSFQLTQARNELNNIRKVFQSMKAQHKGDIERLENLLKSTRVLQELHSSKLMSKSDFQHCPVSDGTTSNCQKQISHDNMFSMKPIGYIRSLHHQKNGTPRQGSVLHLSRGKLEIEKDVFNNPSHSLDGLDEFSHVWIIYLFHQNSSKAKHSKVSPPRLDGKKVGVYSTRSPHRPNGIGLTLAKLDKFRGNCIQLSSIDILDGTPVLDIKPYIPQYDCPGIPLLQETEESPDEIKPTTSEIELDSLCTENDIQINFKEQNFENNLNSCTLFDDDCFYDNTCSKTSFHSEISQYTSIADNKTTNNNNNVQLFEESDCSKEEKHNNLSECIANPENETNIRQTVQLNLQFHDYSDYNPNTDSKITIASWLKSPPISGLEVIFNPIAEAQIKQFCIEAEDPNYRLEYLRSPFELRTAISSVLSEDPRSTYRRQKCQDRLYFFMVDTAHITTWFFQGVAEVLRVHPPSEATFCFKLV